MREIIAWLRVIEHLASEVYLQAATIQWNDPVFTRFLGHLAEEEAWHFHVMGSAANYIAENQEHMPPVSIDEDTSDKILNYFIDMKYGLENGSFSQTELLERIVVAELSEWNDIFFYVVNSLKERTPEFKYPAARIQSHIKGIENYVGDIKGMPDIVKKIKGLPAVWTEKVLIVEDNEMIAELIKSLLHRDGDIDIARNGAEGMSMIEKKYYKLVISDIDMPVMDGISLYKKAVEKYPKLSTRFIFMSGDMSSDRLDFFAANNLKYLKKPMRIKAFRELSMNVLLSN